MDTELECVQLQIEKSGEVSRHLNQVSLWAVQGLRRDMEQRQHWERSPEHKWLKSQQETGVAGEQQATRWVVGRAD